MKSRFQLMAGLAALLFVEAAWSLDSVGAGAQTSEAEAASEAAIQDSAGVETDVAEARARQRELRATLFLKRQSELAARERLYELDVDDSAAEELKEQIAGLEVERLQAESDYGQARALVLSLERNLVGEHSDLGGPEPPWVLGIGLVVLGVLFGGTLRALIQRRAQGARLAPGVAVELDGRRAWVASRKAGRIGLRELDGKTRMLSRLESARVKRLEEEDEVVSILSRVAYSVDVDAAIEVFGRVVDRFVETSELGSYVSGADSISVDRFERDGARLRIMVTAKAVAALAIERELYAALRSEIAESGLAASLPDAS